MAQAIYRKFLLTTLLSGSVILCTDSYAQNGDTYFYPKNKWVVEKVGDQGELPICSISNQLNNGYIVQFAGTKEKLSNINIDFRQSIFEENIKYEVQYTIPGQKSIVIPTKAFKESLLVSDLRKYTDFSNELFDASTVDINIRGNKFRVYLTGLKASMPSYNDCVDPGGLLAKAEAITKQTEKILSAEPKPTSGIAPLPPVNIVEPKVASAPPEDMPANMKRPDFENRERYSDELANKLKEESQRYQPEAQQDAPTENAAVDVAQTESVSEPENEYKAAIDDVKKTVTRKDAVYHITKPSEPLVADLTALDDKPAQEEKPKEIIEVTAAKSASVVETASGNDNEEFVMLRNKISNLEQQVESLSGQNKMLDEELRMALQDSKKEGLTVSSENWNLEKATMKFNEAERQIMRLGRQLQSTRAQCEQEKESLESMLFDPKLTNQKQLAKLASLEAELDETKSELYRQQRQYEERIRLLEQQLKGM